MSGPEDAGGERMEASEPGDNARAQADPHTRYGDQSRMPTTLFLDSGLLLLGAHEI